jgi:hypothetical protein
MGWNDRLPKDLNIPFAEEQDRRAYEEWHHYMLECQRLEEAEGAGLTSANLQLPLQDVVPLPTPEVARPAVPVKQTEPTTN